MGLLKMYSVMKKLSWHQREGKRTYFIGWGAYINIQSQLILLRKVPTIRARPPVERSGRSSQMGTTRLKALVQVAAPWMEQKIDSRTSATYTVSTHSKRKTKTG